MYFKIINCHVTNCVLLGLLLCFDLPVGWAKMTLETIKLNYTNTVMKMYVKVILSKFDHPKFETTSHRVIH